MGSIVGWREDVEYSNYPNTNLLGEDDYGDLYVPSKTRKEYWDRLFNGWNPFHWRYYLWSRITNRIVYLSEQY